MRNKFLSSLGLLKEDCTSTSNFGFGLVELLVVIAISVILFAVGVASYNNFNQNQILNQAASTLQLNLQDARAQALAGEKDCNVCGGGNGICGDGPNEPALVGWRVEFAANSYTIRGLCGSTPLTFRPVTVDLPDGVTINLPLPDISFKSLTHGTNMPDQDIILNFSGKTRTVTVKTSGEIK